MDAIPRFLEAHADELEEEEFTGLPCEPIDWTDVRTGVTLRYAGEAVVDLDDEPSFGDEIRAGGDHSWSLP
jgi:hypothetical protein